MLRDVQKERKRVKQRNKTIKCIKTLNRAILRVYTLTQHASMGGTGSSWKASWKHAKRRERIKLVQRYVIPATSITGAKSTPNKITPNIHSSKQSLLNEYYNPNAAFAMQRFASLVAMASSGEFIQKPGLKRSPQCTVDGTKLHLPGLQQLPPQTGSAHIHSTGGSALVAQGHKGQALPSDLIDFG